MHDDIIKPHDRSGWVPRAEILCPLQNHPDLPDTLLHDLSQEVRERTNDVGQQLLTAGNNPRRRPWLKALQPNEEVPKHFQSVLFAGLHRFAKYVCLAHRIRGILELKIPPVERDGVVEEELRGVPETLWECIAREILKEQVRGVGEEDGNVVGQGFGEDGR